MKRYLFWALIFVSATLTAGAGPKSGKWIDFNKNGVKDLYEDCSASIDDRVEDLLGRMTVEEKTCQLVTLYGAGRVLKEPLPTPEWSSRIWKDGLANIDEMHNGVSRSWTLFSQYVYPFSNHVEAIHQVQRWFVENTRLGIPVEFSNEGIHGLNHAKATPLPAPIGLGCTWDRELIAEAGDIVGREAELLGYHSVYAPILDLARDPRWGRVLECYSEDPYLVAELGKCMAAGIQKHPVSAGLKHFAAYSVPKGGRDADCRTDPHITPRELHEIFLYPFKEVIEETHPMVVMASYNDWNGEPVISSHWFLTELLRDTYGFDGYVVSDSDAVEFLHRKHKTAPSAVEGAKQVLEAGMNVRTNFQMPETYVEPLRKAIESGILSMETVDARVREVLKVKFRMGLFDNPYSGDGRKADKEVGPEHHEDFVMRTNLESFVLLKNEGELLPLDKNALKKVLVTGPLANEVNFMSSRYGPSQLPCTSILAGLKDYLKGSVEVAYEKGCDVVNPGWPTTEIIEEDLSAEELAGIRKAVDAAEGADVIIAVLGEDDERTGESKSRTSLDLPGRQKDLLKALYRTGKPIVLVLVNGQPLTINWENAHIPAILETWFPSFTGGKAVAMTLFGDYNPSGKLSLTFPKSIGQIEYNFPYKKGSHGLQNRGHDPNGSGRTRVQGPIYPFGYGLSYTTFAYSDMSVEEESEGITISATITNTGKRKGTEVVQLYVRDCIASVVTYDSVLRGFLRVTLKPGESRRISFRLKAEDLAILDKNMEWTVEDGDFELMLGASSTDIRLSTLMRRGVRNSLQ